MQVNFLRNRLFHNALWKIILVAQKIKKWMQKLIDLNDSVSFRGNAVVVTSAVQQISSIVRLIAFMLNHDYVEMNCSTKDMFIKNLRMAVRTAGCENKEVTICIKVFLKNPLPENYY